jgi:hypothetical protein
MPKLLPGDVLDNDGFYNPLDEDNLARGVADALTMQAVHTAQPASFSGSGLYALYYIGDFPLYKPLADRCRAGGSTESLNLGPMAIPIYVGKSSAGSSRRGRLEDKTRKNLHARIGKHRGSIKAAKSTLELDHFRIRYLPVRDVWVPLGEAGLLQRFTPLWNVVLEGFGNNSPGSGRSDQAKSTWDTLHPGRKSAESRPDNKLSIPEIRDRVTRAIAAMVAGQDLPEDTVLEHDDIDDEESSR